MQKNPGMIWDLVDQIPDEADRKKASMEAVRDIAEGPWQTVISGLDGPITMSRRESWDPDEAGISPSDQAEAAEWLSENISPVDANCLNAEGLFRALGRANNQRANAESFPEGTQPRRSALNSHRRQNDRTETNSCKLI